MRAFEALNLTMPTEHSRLTVVAAGSVTAHETSTV